MPFKQKDEKLYTKTILNNFKEYYMHINKNTTLDKVLMNKVLGFIRYFVSLHNDSVKKVKVIAWD